MNATLETAYGNANKTIFEAEAVKSTIVEVIRQQADAYELMKSNFTEFGTDQIIGYLKNNLIKDYTSGHIAMQLDM